MFTIKRGVKLSQMRQELDDMLDVLLGTVDPPINVGVATMMEVAEAYHARACEMEIRIKDAENRGQIDKGSQEYLFRTGPLRSFIELTKRTVDMGSRRITALQVEAEMRGGSHAPPE